VVCACFAEVLNCGFDEGWFDTLHGFWKWRDWLRTPTNKRSVTLQAKHPLPFLSVLWSWVAGSKHFE
jgi:hypothetical protein